MMGREEILQTIAHEKIIAIVRGVAVKDMSSVMEALLKGGICMAEITFDHRSEADRKQTLKALELVRTKFENQMYLGAGTVLTTQDVEDAKQAGAQYIISPDTNGQVIARSRELELVSMPGAFTPTEIAKAYFCGADIVKLFPAATLGVGYINAIRGPLGFIPMSAVGGVTPENIPQFLGVGISCFGIGSNLVSAAKTAAGDFAAIEEAARAFTNTLAMLHS